MLLPRGFNPRTGRWYTLAALAALLATAPPGAFAQSPPPKAVTVATGETVLSALRYDPNNAGTLLLIGDPVQDDEAQTLPYWRKTLAGKTPAQFADMLDRRVLTIGGITALVPRTMTVLNTRPGKPDPFADLRGDDRLLLLMAQWTPAQWAKAGSSTGIGAGDLTGEQRPLFAGLFPGDTVTVRTYAIEQDEKYGEVHNLTDESETVAASALRLRLSRGVTVRADSMMLVSPGSSRDGSGLRRVSPDGTPIKRELVLPDTNDGYTDTRRDSAFGVRMVGQEPSRAKPTQLPFDTPRLRVAVSLADGKTTLGDIIARTAKATRLEIIADKRYAAYPVAVRGGRTVRAGDLLSAVCRSVNGTFRKLPDASKGSVYLLTDDIEGYGTRLKRISEWAREPAKIREDALFAAGSGLVKANVAQSLSFLPGDPLAPTPEQIKRINDAGATPGSDTEYAVSDLSPALQEAVRAGAETMREVMKDGIVLERKTLTRAVPERVTLASALRYEWIAPDGRAFRITSGFGRLSGVGSTSAVSKAEAASKAIAGSADDKPPALAPLPATIKRRVAVLSLPATDADTSEMLAAVRGKGFTEAWFRVPFAPDTAERAAFAVGAGKKVGLRVGAGIGWLKKREANPDAPDEIGIAGETGDDWQKRSDSKQVGWDDYNRDVFYPHYVGFVRPRTGDALSVAAKIATIPELSALVIENALPPGYTGTGRYGDGLWERVRLGYDPERRVACVRAEGFDPVDVGEQVLYADFQPSAHPFSEREYELTTALAAFRLGEGTRDLAIVWRTLQAAAPKLPLYLPGLNANGERYPYFVRWDKPANIPHLDGADPESAEQAKAQALRYGTVPMLSLSSPFAADMIPYFAESWKSRAEEAKSWSGFVYDIPWQDAASVRAALALLPNTVNVAPAATAKPVTVPKKP